MTSRDTCQFGTKLNHATKTSFLPLTGWTWILHSLLAQFLWFTILIFIRGTWHVLHLTLYLNVWVVSYFSVTWNFVILCFVVLVQGWNVFLLKKNYVPRVKFDKQYPVLLGLGKQNNSKNFKINLKHFNNKWLKSWLKNNNLQLFFEFIYSFYHFVSSFECFSVNFIRFCLFTLYFM